MMRNFLNFCHSAAFYIKNQRFGDCNMSLFFKKNLFQGVDFGDHFEL